MSPLRYTIMALLVAGVSLPGLNALGTEPTPSQTPAPWKIVNYWSTTCAPCRIEIPELNLLFAELAASNVQVLGVNFDEDDRQTTLRLARRLGIEFPTLTLSEVEALGLSPPTALPTTYILSPTNEMLTKLVGIQTKASVYTILTKLAIPH